MRAPFRTAAVLTGLLAGSAATASASILFDAGPSFVQPGENLLFHGPGPVAGSGLTEHGATNQASTALNLTGLTNLVTTASGQSRIEDELNVGFTSLLVDGLAPDVFHDASQASLNANGNGDESELLPEPSALALLGITLGVAGRWARRRQ